MKNYIYSWEVIQMKKQQIKVGDRVQVLKDSFRVVETGSRGKVVVIDRDLVGVELDKEYSKGHDCDGYAKYWCGRYFYPKDLKVLEEE